MGNDAIYNKLLDIEGRITHIEDCQAEHIKLHQAESGKKTRRADFWEKILSGAIGAGIVIGLNNVKLWFGLK
jgi:hypothetical protein